MWMLYIMLLYDQEYAYCMDSLCLPTCKDADKSFPKFYSTLHVCSIMFCEAFALTQSIKPAKNGTNFNINCPFHLWLCLNLDFMHQTYFTKLHIASSGFSVWMTIAMIFFFLNSYTSSSYKNCTMWWSVISFPWCHDDICLVVVYSPHALRVLT
jgi:hypothetical protein